MGIENYSDFTPLLGKRWYIRIVNPRKNFCYVNKETVQFWIHRKKDIEEFDDEGGYSVVLNLCVWMVLLMNWTVFCKYNNFNFVQSCNLYIMHNCITVDEYVLEIMSTKITT